MIAAYIEHDRGVLNEASLQMLTCAREVAGTTGSDVWAVVAGEEAQGVVQEMQKYAPDKIIWVRHSHLTDYAPQAFARSIHDLIVAKAPEMVMAAATDQGSEVMAHLGALSGQPLAANCCRIEPKERVEVTRQRWGGSLLERAELKGDPKLLTVGLQVFEPLVPGEPAGCEVEEFAPSVTDKDFRVRLTERQETVSEGVTLKTAPVVVGGGRGVGSEEGYRILEELAGLLKGAVGGSRVATNNGWRSHADQVGSTGNRISPDIYIACGISGAIQHLVGCKGAKKIMVINQDPEAPFFAKADYGVLGDLHQVVPAIIEEIRKTG